jgi:hypothetical protein
LGLSPFLLELPSLMGSLAAGPLSWRTGYGCSLRSIAEQEGYLWSACEEYMRGDRDLESLDQIEEECDDVSLLDTSSHSVVDNLMNFVGGFFR